MTGRASSTSVRLPAGRLMWARRRIARRRPANSPSPACCGTNCSARASASARLIQDCRKRNFRWSVSKATQARRRNFTRERIRSSPPTSRTSWSGSPAVRPTATLMNLSSNPWTRWKSGKAFGGNKTGCVIPETKFTLPAFFHASRITHHESEPPVRAPEQRRADALKKKIRQPQDQVRIQFRPRRQRSTKHGEAVINRDESQRQRDADVRLAPVDADAERNADQRETEARKRKSNF